ncbi:MAG TPA: YbhB/YbcL family Raf kinase inhibitor-like protein [Pseudonocardiaceae bacterium]|jgi:hypothetical protein|nr:YbhB/YbcL family Raf kinase inhibitor-like protein [Pseudonocardiaceae bacterium]
MSVGDIELRSPAFGNGDPIPERYTKDGGNDVPPLEWSEVPHGTAELALICDDPDAPGGSFVHWVLTGIPPTRTGLTDDELPATVAVGRNGFGELGWGGPRPPAGGPHRYFFRLYAADQPLGLADGVDAEHVRAAIAGHVIARGTLVGLFAR